MSALKHTYEQHTGRSGRAGARGKRRQQQSPVVSLFCGVFGPFCSFIDPGRARGNSLRSARVSGGAASQNWTQRRLYRASGPGTQDVLHADRSSERHWTDVKGLGPGREQGLRHFLHRVSWTPGFKTVRYFCLSLAKNRMLLKFVDFLQSVFKRELSPS